MVSDNNFVTIQGWMLKLNLNPTELILFAVIYGFTQDGGEHWFKGGASYLASWCNVSIDTVYRTLKKLTEQKVLEKNKYIKSNNELACDYKVNLDYINSIIDGKSATDGTKSDCAENSKRTGNTQVPTSKLQVPTSKLSEHNNIYNNNSNNNIIFSNENISPSVQCDSELTKRLTNTKSTAYNPVVPDLRKALESTKGTKEKDPFRFTGFKFVVDKISELPYNAEIISAVDKWYRACGVGKVSVRQIMDRLDHMKELECTDAEIVKSLNDAYVNGWNGFFPPAYKDDKRKDAVKSAQNLIKPTTRDDRVYNADGTVKVINFD